MSRRTLVIPFVAGAALLVTNDGRGETKVLGVQGECRMTIHTVPGLGGAAKAATWPEPEVVHAKRTLAAYEVAPDGRALIVHRAGGYELRSRAGAVTRRIEVQSLPTRDVRWNPDSRRLLVWGQLDEDGKPPRGDVRHRHAHVLLIDAGADGKETVAYDPAAHHVVEGSGADVIDPHPQAFEWSPDGEAFFVLEREYPKNDPRRGLESAIHRVDLARPDEAKVVARMSGEISRLLVPTSRASAGPSKKPWRLVFAHDDGLFVVDPRGGEPRRLPELPAKEVWLAEWSPDPAADQLLIGLRSAPAQTAADRVLLLHLDRIGRPERGEWAEPLRERCEAHTVAFSPGGAWATWAAKDQVAYRKAKDGKAKPIVVACASEGTKLQVKGCRWHADEVHLAIAAGDRLFVHDASSGETTEVARVGEDPALEFAGDPWWLGDDVLFTRFEDVTELVREAQRRPELKVKGQGGQ